MHHFPSAIAAAFAAISLSLSVSTAACAGHHEQPEKGAIAAAVAADTRTPANVTRDRYRHPAETLEFFGVRPNQTVLELFPGGGWYSEILGPLLQESGTYYASPPSGRYYDMFTERAAETPSRFGKVIILAWPLAEGSVPAGSIDTVLTFRNVHNLVMNDAAPAAFATFFAMLKPGGVLGIVEHRLPEDRDAAMEKTSGYLKLSTIRKLAENAGFVLEAQSEINANPKDTADWEKGVWTLPPVLRGGDTDREKYLAIGESDRMTLRFRKPDQ